MNVSPLLLCIQESHPHPPARADAPGHSAWSRLLQTRRECCPIVAPDRPGCCARATCRAKPPPTISTAILMMRVFCMGTSLRPCMRQWTPCVIWPSRCLAPGCWYPCTYV